MNLVKKGRKWVVEGNGEGWIYKWVFPVKWKAIVGMEVFQKGGRVTDYKVALKNQPPRLRTAGRVKQELVPALEMMQELEPTTEEIEKYGENAGYGIVTYTQKTRYYPPSLHDTWGMKQGGRVHIDVGSNGTHLMLDKSSALGFIDFIKDRRGLDNSDKNMK